MTKKEFDEATKDMPEDAEIYKLTRDILGYRTDPIKSVECDNNIYVIKLC